jgi:hypothetical protein
MAITKTITYTCTDGKVFTDANLADIHERDVQMKAQDRFKEWTRSSYSGKRLLEKHSLNETGTWRIRGEDPNCDFGGHHHNPDLGTVEGRLEDVIRYAVGVSGFYTWGHGGDIVKVEIKKV